MYLRVPSISVRDHLPKQLVLVPALVLSALACQLQAQSLEARVDRRVELMSILFRLAGNSEYNLPNSESVYSKRVERHFGPFREHPAVQRARELRAERGVSFDAVMGLAVHLTDTLGLGEKTPFDPRPSRLDRRWRIVEAREFLELARSFVRETGFNRFMAEQEDLFDAAAARMAALLSKRKYLAWFDRFFGARPQARFAVILGMLNGGGNYGMGIRYPDGSEEITPIIGAWKFDALGVPVLDDSLVPTIVHEFCHSYSNQIVDRHADQLAAAGKLIYAHCEEVMRRQAYTTWPNMLRESMVRACVVRNLLATEGQAAGSREARRQHALGFEWVGELADLLGEYEADRTTYPTLDDFMPVVADFFEEYAQGYHRRMTELEQRRPKVLATVPENGKGGVDPGLSEITVTFDRPMRDRSWSVIGDGPTQPEIIDDLRYDDERRRLTIPVELKPDWSYRFWLNRGRFNSFQSAQGVPLRPLEFSFRTARPWRFPAVERIVAIGDLHGDLAATRRALRLAGAIDDQDRWIGGELVVVQTGDQLDRGDHEREILDLLERLTAEAARAGGALHALNGNHELMNVALDFRYVTPGGFAEFRDPRDAAGQSTDDPQLLDLKPDRRARGAAFRPGGPYARLLARRNTIVMVGETVFVHGGVLPAHVEYGIARLNQEVRDWLKGDAAPPDAARGSASPVWTRLFSSDVDDSDCEALSRTLELLGAKRMVVGHTVQKGGIRGFCDGRVFCIDVGLAAHYGGATEVLEIVGDRVRNLVE